MKQSLVKATEDVKAAKEFTKEIKGNVKKEIVKIAENIIDKIEKPEPKKEIETIQESEVYMPL